jgi:hypothetical protein
MILYHVRFDLENTDRKFVPREPYYPMVGEDKHIPRICLSTSIEGAVSACPSGAERLDLVEEVQEGLFLVFKVDTEKLGITEIIESESLERYGVFDSYLTGEVWVLEEFELPESDLFICSAKSFDLVRKDVKGNKGALNCVENLELCGMEDQQSFRDLRQQVLYSTEYQRNHNSVDLIYNNPFQISQIKKSIKEGFDIRPFVTPLFDSRQMREIRIGLSQGLNVSLYANHNINFQNMLMLRKALLLGLDVSNYLDLETSYVEISDFIKSHEQRSMKSMSTF